MMSLVALILPLASAFSLSLPSPTPTTPSHQTPQPPNPTPPSILPHRQSLIPRQSNTTYTYRYDNTDPAACGFYSGFWDYGEFWSGWLWVC